MGRMRQRKGDEVTEQAVVNSPSTSSMGHGHPGPMWFDAEELRMDHVLRSKQFWKDVVRHAFFPIFVLANTSRISHHLSALYKDPSSAKLRHIWRNKLLSFFAAHVTLVASAVIWELFHGHQSTEISDIPGHLLRNFSLLLPCVVYVFYHSAIPLVGATLQGVLYQRQLAVPPTLLLSENSLSQLAIDGASKGKLNKTERGIAAYQQWEEAFETSFVRDALQGRAGGRLSDALGALEAGSEERVLRWVTKIQAEARMGKWWGRVWPVLGWLNGLHVGLAIGMTGWEVWKGKAGWLAFALSVVQSGVSGYFWWSSLRTGLLAVMHFSRVRELSQAVTRVLGVELRVPGRGGVHPGGGEELSEQTLMDWWRLRTVVEVATSPFSAMYWLAFSCNLLADLCLSLFLVAFFTLSGGSVRLRHLLPVALDQIIITVLLMGVLLFSMLANGQCQKQTRALAARKIELVAHGLAFHSLGQPQQSNLAASLDVVRCHLEANARKHRLFGLTDVTPSLMLKLAGFLVGGPISVLVRIARQLEM